MLSLEPGASRFASISGKYTSLYIFICFFSINNIGIKPVKYQPGGTTGTRHLHIVVFEGSFFSEIWLIWEAEQLLYSSKKTDTVSCVYPYVLSFDVQETILTSLTISRQVALGQWPTGRFVGCDKTSWKCVSVRNNWNHRRWNQHIVLFFRRPPK